jgi:hypothetical protein
MVCSIIIPAWYSLRYYPQSITPVHFCCAGEVLLIYKFNDLQLWYS